MRKGISSVNDTGFVCIDVLVNPLCPCGESFVIGLHDLKNWMHIVSFLVIIYSDSFKENKKKSMKEKTKLRFHIIEETIL